MTDKPLHGPTSVDDARVADLTHYRAALLNSQEVKQRLRSLAAARDANDNQAWLLYWTAVGELARDLDYTFTEPEIDEIARKWTPDEVDGLGRPWPHIGIGFVAGRTGRGRAMKASTVDLAARSTALRAGGLPPTAADSQAVDELLPLAIPQVAAKYRQRLRDRLDRP